MRIGSFDPIDYVRDRYNRLEHPAPAALLNANDAQAGRGPYRIIDARRVSGERVRATKGTEDSVAAGRDVQQIGRWIGAYAPYQIYLIHDLIGVSINRDDSIRCPVCNPEVAIFLR